MRRIVDRFVVILDANVLFPFRVRDALLRFAEAGLFRARWSQAIIAEWKRNLLMARPELRSSIEAQIEAMQRAFPESSVDGADVLIDALVLPDPGDRHVLATAILAGAEHIVTENLRDFPANALEKFGITAVTADDFLTSTFELYPAEAIAAVKLMRSEYRNPPFTPNAFLFDLQAKGLPKFASVLRKTIDLI